jgi:hypothetical protein
MHARAVRMRFFFSEYPAHFCLKEFISETFRNSIYGFVILALSSAGCNIRAAAAWKLYKASGFGVGFSPAELAIFHPLSLDY